MSANDLVTFGVALVVSAFGSLPVGVINLLTIQVSVKQGMKTAFQFVLLASLAEWPHLVVTLWLAKFLQENSFVQTYFEYAAIVFILIMGVVNVIRKSPENNEVKPFSWYFAFAITVFNPFSIPFWLFVTTYLLNEHWIDPQFSTAYYILGAIVGAFIALIGYALLGKWITQTNILQKVNIDRSIGFVFIGLAIWKIFGLFF
ncbi:MAG: LysE family translocator [Cytophagales bacterium]|nr:LysE family translocator [Cytophagales bacterium]